MSTSPRHLPFRNGASLALLAAATVAAFLALGLVACSPESGAASGTASDAATAAADVQPTPGAIETSVEDFAFNAPATLPSGWNHLRMTNTGEQPHFMAFMRLPEGHTFDEYAEQVSRPFNDQYKVYRSGAVDRTTFLNELGGALPEWFGAVEFTGGVGLTSPGRTAESWVYLEPGNYVLECYIVSPKDGVFHNDLGMLRPLIVSVEGSNVEPPEANAEFALSNYQLQMDGELVPGRNVVAVRVDEKAEGLIAHDLLLAKLDADTDLQEVITWLDWVDHMMPPAPAEFLGGAEGVSVPGRTSYVAVDLEPGRYAWLSEGYASQGMVHEFTIE